MGEGDDRPSRDEDGDRGRAEPNKLFIGQLAFEAEEGDIQEKFGRYGEILNIQIIKDNMTGKSKGYGFIKFAETSDAEKVLRTMDGAEICGRKCKLDKAGAGRQNTSRFDRDDRRGGGRGRDDRKPTEPEKLFVGKLSPDATEDDVREAFRRVGDIKVQLIKDRDTGESRGFGFITFSDASKAEEALRTYQGTEIAGQGCRLERPGQKPQGGQRGGRDSRSPSRRDRGRGDGRSRSRGRRQDRDDWRHGRGGRDRFDARGPRDRRQGGRGDRGDRDRGDRGDRGDRDRGDRDRGDRRGERDRGDRDRGERDRGGERDRRDRGRVDRDERARDESVDSRDSRAQEAQRERRSRTPDGLPRKSEAISAARNAYEDAYQRVQDAREEADAAEASLKKMQKEALRAVDRKVADETDRIKGDLEDRLSDMRSKAKNTLALSMDTSELKLREELAEKIAQLRKEYDVKVKDEHARLRREHEDEAEDAENKEQEAAEKKIEELRKKAEKEENPWEWREARDKAVDTLEKEEEKLESAKRRLESLTGQTVKEPRSRPRSRSTRSLLPREKRSKRPPPPQARGRD